MTKIATILLLLILCSCKQVPKNQHTADVTEINLESTKPLLNLFDSPLIDSVSFIQLETNNNCLLSTNLNIIYANNSYYILDKRKCFIYVFNSDGSYKFKIGKKGKGPGEFLNISDFDIYNSKIKVLATMGNTKLLEYDWNSGKLLHEKTLKQYPSSFKQLSDDQILFYGKYEYNDKEYKLQILDNSLQKSETYLIESNNNRPIIGEVCIYRGDNINTNYYWSHMEGSIYKIENSNAQQIFQIEEARKQQDMINNSQMNEYMSKNNLFITNTVVCNNNYCHISEMEQTSNGVKVYNILINRRTHVHEVFLSTNPQSLMASYLFKNKLLLTMDSSLPLSKKLFPDKPINSNPSIAVITLKD